MSEAERIAGELTEAQRALLFWLPAGGEWRRTHESDFNRHGVNALCGFGKSGLIDGYYGRCEMRHRLTPLGLEVKRILERKG